MSAIVRVRDKNGVVHDITAIVGPKGDPGTDASVTAENIQAALGYTPGKVPESGAWGIINNVNGEIALNPASKGNINSRSTRQPITPENLDYAVKAAMCDGKGAAWTANEQKAARDRMGIDKAYELIETIMTDGTAIVEREAEPNGTPYNFSHAIVVITSPKNIESSIAVFCHMVTWDVSLSSYAMFQKNVAYFKRAMFLADVVKGILTYKSTDSMNSYANQQDQGTTDSGTLRQSPTLKFTSSNIRRIKVCDTNVSAIPAGFLIQIYGVRA